MRSILLSTIFFFAACKSTPYSHLHIEKIIPDSVGSYYAEQFHKDYLLSRKIVDSFKLQNISNGTKNQQVWFWDMSSSYDPQTIYILHRKSSDGWHLKVIKYYAFQKDSITSDVTKTINSNLFDTLNVDRFWKLPSQSQLKNGDKYGCVDGNTVLIEMADSTRYKYIFFRCPDIHADKDTAFYLVN